MLAALAWSMLWLIVGGLVFLVGGLALSSRVMLLHVRRMHHARFDTRAPFWTAPCAPRQFDDEPLPARACFHGNADDEHYFCPRCGQSLAIQGALRYGPAVYLLADCGVCETRFEIDDAGWIRPGVDHVTMRRGG
ncbi:MAG: hypothetical protein ACKVT0_03420 [Planctomycetaceae bacterium]